MKPNFGFDLDGVLYDWAGAAYEYIKYLGKADLPLVPFWKRNISGTEPFTELFWKDIIKIPTIYTMYSAKKEDVETLQELSKYFSLYYITHRPEEVQYTTYSWLKKNGFPDIHNLFHTKQRKEIAVRLHDCKYYVEDRPEYNLRYVTRLFVKTTYYNDPYTKDNDGITVIDNISEILNYI